MLDPLILTMLTPTLNWIQTNEFPRPVMLFLASQITIDSNFIMPEVGCVQVQALMSGTNTKSSQHRLPDVSLFSMFCALLDEV